jgi:hypothetical protein
LPPFRLSVKWYCILPRVSLNASVGTITKGTKGPPMVRPGDETVERHRDVEPELCHGVG